MLTRDLVLRICANATEFDPGWLHGGKRSEKLIAAPFTAARDTALLKAIAAAGNVLGADRLLVCRTRAEHAYDPVTEIPVDSDALLYLVRQWGNAPTDFLVAVEDATAAVLVTAGTLTVPAGPIDFVREVAGEDVARVRADFAAEARSRQDPDLLRAAQHYNCLEQGGSHGDGARSPGPDPAERAATQAERMRETRPRLTGRLRAARGGMGWLMAVLLIAAGVLQPGLLGALPIALAMVWLLVQLAWLARSRTVGFAGLMRMLVLGAAMAYPIALAEGAVAGALGMAVEDPYAYAYVAVPVEEVGKLAPLLLLWLVARRRCKRLAAVDYLLLAAAGGAGFQLVEQALHAVVFADYGGAVAPNLGPAVFLPGWIDLAGAGVRFSGHAVTTGLVGAAIGLAIVGSRKYGAWLWFLPPLALGAAALEHMVFNAALVGLDPTPLTATVFAVYGNGALTRWLLLLLLVCAVVLDYRVARLADDAAPPLPGTAPLAALRRRAHGRAVRLRVRVPGDIVPVFRRLARTWARLPVTLSEALASVLHEFAIQLVAASREPAALYDAWRFLRARREYAMGAFRAAGKPWRQVPDQERLAGSGSRLADMLAPERATAAAAAAVAVIGLLVLPAFPAGMSGAVDGGTGTGAETEPAAYAAVTVRAVQDWFDPLATGYQVWAVAGLVALLVLLGTGWSVPRAQPSTSRFLRDPLRNTGGFLGALAPGQLPYAVAGLVGMAVPKKTDRLLRPKGERTRT